MNRRESYQFTQLSLKPALPTEEQVKAAEKAVNLMFAGWQNSVLKQMQENDKRDRQ